MVRQSALLLLTFVSVVAKGVVKVDIGTFTGGSVIEKSQSEPAADGSVVVTITVTPENGYEIRKADVTVMPTLAPSETRASQAPSLAEPLTLYGDDPEDLSQPRDYTFTVGAGLGAWVQTATFRKKAKAVENGIYRICFEGKGKWYLWPSVTTDADGHPYLTTFNGISAPALEYAAKGIAYDAFSEEYSLWQVTQVDSEGSVCYQLYNVGMQQYVVWSAVEGLRAVHLEASPADESHTWFRFDQTADGYLITPVGATAGTTLNSKAGDKPFLCSSGAANAATGYPDGEPDPDGDNGLMQIYSEGTPVWSFESAGVHIEPPFSKTSEEETEQAALFHAPTDLALPEGLKAYMVTGVSVSQGKVIIQEVDYLPAEMPLLLIAEGENSGYELQAKDSETPALSEQDRASNLLKIGSPEVQPTPYEDYIFFRGEFVMVDGGVLPSGKMFLDLSSEQAASARSVLGVGSSASGTTGILDRMTSPEGSSGVHWFTIDGRRLSVRPTAKGIYIRNGRKEIVR